MVLALREIHQDTNKHRNIRKQNKYQNKSKIPNRDNIRPIKFITEKYLQNDKHVEKR